MALLNLKGLIAKLNAPSRKALEAAAGLCLSRTQFDVEIEHWLLKLLEIPDSDLNVILPALDINVGKLINELEASIKPLKTGNSRAPALSQQLIDWMREAWLVTALEFNETHIRSGYLLFALLHNPNLRRLVAGMSHQLAGISMETLHQQLPILLTRSNEGFSKPQTDEKNPVASVSNSKTPALDQFTVNLTEQARQGKLDPIIGRDMEIRQIIDILSRRRQNNPILTGEAGVGKTAVVEGFALRIVQGEVPDVLKNVSLRILDLGLLQAGASVKGEFENRLKNVISEVKAFPTPIILFIDEAHTLIGAGAQVGQNDAANLLKPALARGELRTIAATTWQEYKKYFEQDPALVRRFQVIKVDEPSESIAITMLSGLVNTLEQHHQVKIRPDAIEQAVKLSNRYLQGRQLPDKAVSLLDTACARVAISQKTIPAVIEEQQKQLAQFDSSERLHQRERKYGHDHNEKLENLKQQKDKVNSKLAALNQQWQKEQELVAAIQSTQYQLEQAAEDISGENFSATQLRQQLQQHLAELIALQGELPLLQYCVDGQAVAQLVAEWTGIPVGKMLSQDINNVLQLKEQLARRVIGQSQALAAIDKCVRTSRAGLTDPNKPLGIFLFVGPSGVGKTETALALAELLYGGEQNMTVINMSEFKEEHKLSMLVGSPPGYVGYGEGGVLTEAVRRRPYSLILLDEMEKAHPGVQDIFYQVFDKGTLRDGQGRDINFKNTLIIMTSNAASELISELCRDPQNYPDVENLNKAIKHILLQYFKPAFLGRVTIIPYFPISDNNLKHIAELQLQRVAQRIALNYQAQLTYAPELITHIVQRCTEVDTGARNIQHIIAENLLPELSTEFLAYLANSKKVNEINVALNQEGKFYYQIK